MKQIIMQLTLRKFRHVLRRLGFWGGSRVPNPDGLITGMSGSAMLGGRDERNCRSNATTWMIVHDVHRRYRGTLLYAVQKLIGGGKHEARTCLKNLVNRMYEDESGNGESLSNGERENHSNTSESSSSLLDCLEIFGKASTGGGDL